MSNDYPKTVSEILDDNMKFRPGVLRTIQNFAASRTWYGSIPERWEKFNHCSQGICRIYGIDPPKLIYEASTNTDSGYSAYFPYPKIILLRGRLSVVTFLHELAHHLYGSSERQACRWSINLFRRCFPKSWRGLEFDGHMVRRRDVEGSL